MDNYTEFTDREKKLLDKIRKMSLVDINFRIKTLLVLIILAAFFGFIVVLGVAIHATEPVRIISAFLAVLLVVAFVADRREFIQQTLLIRKLIDKIESHNNIN